MHPMTSLEEQLVSSVSNLILEKNTSKDGKQEPFQDPSTQYPDLIRTHGSRIERSAENATEKFPAFDAAIAETDAASIMAPDTIRNDWRMSPFFGFEPHAPIPRIPFDRKDHYRKLKNFSRHFELNTPFPDDVLPFIRKDKRAQHKVKERAEKLAQAQNRVVVKLRRELHDTELASEAVWRGTPFELDRMKRPALPFRTLTHHNADVRMVHKSCVTAQSIVLKAQLDLGKGGLDLEAPSLFFPYDDHDAVNAMLDFCESFCSIKDSNLQPPVNLATPAPNDYSLPPYLLGPDKGLSTVSSDPDLALLPDPTLRHWAHIHFHLTVHQLAHKYSLRNLASLCASKILSLARNIHWNAASADLLYRIIAFALPDRIPSIQLINDPLNFISLRDPTDPNAHNEDHPALYDPVTHPLEALTCNPARIAARTTPGKMNWGEYRALERIVADIIMISLPSDEEFRREVRPLGVKWQGVGCGVFEKILERIDRKG